MVLPSGLGVPPLPYLAAIVAGTLIVAAVLVELDPPIDQRTVVALAPWMAVGGTLHALHQPPIELYTPALSPLFGAPAVYLTTFNITGTVWVFLALFGVRGGHDETVPRNLGIVGTGILTVLLVLTLITAFRSGYTAVVWPAASVLGSMAIAGAALLLAALWRTPVIIRARYSAPVVVFAHTFDGFSTAIGTDIVGVAERSPIPRAIMEFTGSLPTAAVLGSGWLFLLLKVVLAVAIVFLMDQYVQEDPSEGSIILALIAAVGIGPATNNVVLFLFSPV